MSFVKKIHKKLKKFVKKWWKVIVIAALVVFTAGIATIGFSAFAGASGFSGFMGAVGSTMGAGVAGIAGTVGIGSGATVGAGGLGGTGALAGTKVGFGAAAGLGGGAGVGAGSAAAKAALAKTATGTVSMTGQGLAAANYAASTKVGAAAINKSLVTKGLGTTLGNTVTAGTTVAGGGSSVASVLQGVGAVAGPAMTMYGKMKESEAANAPPLAQWGVEIGREPEYYEGNSWRYMNKDNPAIGQEALMGAAPVGNQALGGAGNQTGFSPTGYGPEQPQPGMIDGPLMMPQGG